MYRPANPGKPRRAGKARAFLACIALGLGAGLGGCSTTPVASNDKMGDPLLGQAPPAAATSTSQHADNGQGGLPPLPASAGLSTNAALAGQSSTPQALAITNADGWARKAEAAKTPAQPVSQPRVEPVPKDTGSAASPAPALQGSGQSIQNTAWTAGYTSNEQIEQVLKEHGVIGHNQEPVAGGVRLTCIVQIPSNPNAVQNYYTTAADYPTAAQAIVHEIEAHRANP